MNRGHVGTEYRLVRDDNWTSYDLGKAPNSRSALGAFQHAVSSGHVYYKVDDAPSLAHVLRTYWIPPYWGPLPDAYFDEIAADIVRWAGGQMFEFIADHEDDDRFHNHEKTGSRYRTD
jgi:hypothetical protein